MKNFRLFKKIKPIYIILGLLAIVLIVSALGSIKEGMTSGENTQLKSLNVKRNDTLDKIYVFVNASKSSGWDSDDSFLTSLNEFLKVYSTLGMQNFMKSRDVNVDGKVVVDKNNKFIRDNSGNYTNSDEKLFYYDLKSQDISNDGLIVAYKDSDRGNFYRDNSGNEVFPTSSPYIIQTIGTNNVTQYTVDSAKLVLDNKINMLSNADDKNTINTLISDLIGFTDKIISIINTKITSPDSSYTYDPNDVYVSTIRTRDRERERLHVNEPTYWKNMYSSQFNEGFNTSYNNLATGSTGTSQTGTSQTGTSQTNNSDLSSIATSASNVPSNGTINGASSQTNIAPGNEDLYMLKTQMIPPNCPVGGCGTGASSANNIRPAAVPPCPPCERCPEPSFECKKVPTYNSASNNKYLPRPVLADFSQFGM
jgi:hypothetical protein